MKADDFLDIIETISGRFYTGVPDSLLKPLLDAITDRYGISDNHIVAANEGAAVALAAGHYLATAKPAVVYMQNSGIGNAVNPICSLLHEKVFSIPCLFIIGWRGQPFASDEPQHIFQGEITTSMLEMLEIPYVLVNSLTTSKKLTDTVNAINKQLESGRSVAFLVCKGAFETDEKICETNKKSWISAEKLCGFDSELTREEALYGIFNVTEDKTVEDETADNCIFVCTTGKLSREVFEIRERQGKKHNRDFLTVGSMGHSISIAHGIAISQPNMRIICLDGDGAVLMHLGSLAVCGVHGVKNLVHIVFNNGAHESVGGMQTVCRKLNLSEIAKTLGYKESVRVQSVNEIKKQKDLVMNSEGPVFIEVLCNLKSRKDLGRPTTSPKENKRALMGELGNRE